MRTQSNQIKVENNWLSMVCGRDKYEMIIVVFFQMRSRTAEAKTDPAGGSGRGPGASAARPAAPSPASSQTRTPRPWPEEPGTDQVRYQPYGIHVRSNKGGIGGSELGVQKLIFFPCWSFQINLERKNVYTMVST